MCIEDIRIGRKIYSRITEIAANPTNFDGNSLRIGIKLIILAPLEVAGTFAYLQSQTVAATTKAFAYVTGNRPVEELTLQQHGTLVQQPFAANTFNNGAVVIEFFLDDQENPPKPNP